MHQHCVQLIYAACKCAGRSSLRLSAEVNVSLMKSLVTVMVLHEIYKSS